MKRFLLKVFGWVPVPSFTLRLLPRKHKKKIATNFLDAVGTSDLEAWVLPFILEKAESRFDPKKSRKFSSTKEEVDEALEGFPVLSPYKVYFMRVCNRMREKHGLPL